MKVRLIITLLAPLFFSACSRPALGPPTQEVAVEEGFRFNLPENLFPTEDLHPYACLQYANEKAGVYLVGIAESKKSIRDLNLSYTLEDYAHAINRKVGRGLDSYEISLEQGMTLGQSACISSDIWGEINEGGSPLKVYYNVSVFESPEYFYQLVSWTDQESISQNKPELEKIVCSFQFPLDDLSALSGEKKGVSGEGLSQ